MTSLIINNKDFVAEEIGLQKSNAFVMFIRKIDITSTVVR